MTISQAEFAAMQKQLKDSQRVTKSLTRKVNDLSAGLERILGVPINVKPAKDATQIAVVEKTAFVPDFDSMTTGPDYGVSRATTTDQKAMEKVFDNPDLTWRQAQAFLESDKGDKGRVYVAQPVVNDTKFLTNLPPYAALVNQVMRSAQQLNALGVANAFAATPRLDIHAGGIHNFRQMAPYEAIARAKEGALTRDGESSFHAHWTELLADYRAKKGIEDGKKRSKGKKTSRSSTTTAGAADDGEEPRKSGKGSGGGDGRRGKTSARPTKKRAVASADPIVIAPPADVVVPAPDAPAPVPVASTAEEPELSLETMVSIAQCISHLTGDEWLAAKDMMIRGAVAELKARQVEPPSMPEPMDMPQVDSAVVNAIYREVCQNLPTENLLMDEMWENDFAPDDELFIAELNLQPVPQAPVSVQAPVTVVQEIADAPVCQRSVDRLFRDLAAHNNKAEVTLVESSSSASMIVETESTVVCGASMTIETETVTTEPAPVLRGSSDIAVAEVLACLSWGSDKGFTSPARAVAESVVETVPVPVPVPVVEVVVEKPAPVRKIIVKNSVPAGKSPASAPAGGKSPALGWSNMLKSAPLGVPRRADGTLELPVNLPYLSTAGKKPMGPPPLPKKAPMSAMKRPKTLLSVLEEDTDNDDPRYNRVIDIDLVDDESPRPVRKTTARKTKAKTSSTKKGKASSAKAAKKRVEEPSVESISSSSASSKKSKASEADDDLEEMDMDESDAVTRRRAAPAPAPALVPAVVAAPAPRARKTEEEKLKAWHFDSNPEPYVYSTPGWGRFH